MQCSSIAITVTSDEARVSHAPTLGAFHSRDRPRRIEVVELVGRPKGLRVRTGCATEEEFIALYKMKCDETSIFAVTQKMLPQGAACAFSLELVDGSPMVRGLGVVIESFATAGNPFGDAGVHIQFDQLTTSSDPIVD